MEDFAEAAMEKVREYSMLFMVIIILVRPISSYSEISVFESSVALLAGVFMADNYYMEYMNDRISPTIFSHSRKNVLHCSNE